VPNFSLDEKVLLLGVIMRYQKLKEDASDFALEQELSLTPEELNIQISAVRQKILNES
jgi:septum formation topological specificity factor MinE